MTTTVRSRTATDARGLAYAAELVERRMHEIENELMQGVSESQAQALVDEAELCVRSLFAIARAEALLAPDVPRRWRPWRR